MIQRPPLRAVLGVALLVGCFTLAINLRSREHKERREPGQRQTRLVSSQESRPMSEALLVRIARPGQAGVTLLRASEEAPWTIRDADFPVDQERVATLITTLESRCSGVLYEPDESSPARVTAEVLVGRHTFRLVEHERGVHYALERGGHPCQQRGEYIALRDAKAIGLSAVQLRAR